MMVQRKYILITLLIINAYSMLYGMEERVVLIPVKPIVDKLFAQGILERFPEHSKQVVDTDLYYKLKDIKGIKEGSTGKNSSLGTLKYSLSEESLITLIKGIRGYFSVTEKTCLSDSKPGSGSEEAKKPEAFFVKETRYVNSPSSALSELLKSSQGLLFQQSEPQTKYDKKELAYTHRPVVVAKSDSQEDCYGDTEKREFSEDETLSPAIKIVQSPSQRKKNSKKNAPGSNSSNTGQKPPSDDDVLFGMEL